MPSFQLDDYRWLVSDVGQHWLDHASHFGGDALSMSRVLRNHLAASHTALVVEMIELRQRAREKFKAAASLLFTRRALEQATDDAVAQYKASRFPVHAHIFDLGCGVGGDALALATRAKVCAVDCDPVMTLLTSTNAQVLGRHVETRTADMREVPIDADDLLHIDPDRRSDGRRVAIDVASYEPPLAALEMLVQRARGAVVKLAPAAICPIEWERTAELEWITSRGECRQQVAWINIGAARSGYRCATAVNTDGQVVGQFYGHVEPLCAIAARLGRYVYEPDRAILAAKLTDAVAREHSLERLESQVAYLTSDEPLQHPLLAGFEVVDHLPFDRKRVKAWLREHNIGTLEIKKRAVGIDPRELFKQLAPKGDKAITLILAPTQQGRTIAIFANRLKWDGPK